MKNKKALSVVLILIVVSVIGVYLINLQKGKSKLLTPFPLTRTHTFNGITYEGSYERYNKIIQKAINSKNPNICDEINFGQDQGDYTTSIEESRYFCKADYAVKASDVDYCKTLDSEVKFVGTIVQRDKCLIDLAKKLNDKSLCEFLSNKIYCPIK